MALSILTLIFILAITYWVDYRALMAEGNKTQLITYGTLFSVGFIVTGLYLLDPELPNPVRLIEGQLQPIRSWLTP